MGWEDYHLHAFRVGGREFAPRGSGLGARDEEKVRLNELLGPGGKLDYEYDFGDGWEHTITVEKALSREDGGVYPRCIKGKGACPPEDSGGLYGYYDKLAIARDPNDDEYEDVLAWLGAGFDPDAFDLAASAARVAAVPVGDMKRKR